MAVVNVPARLGPAIVEVLIARRGVSGSEMVI